MNFLEEVTVQYAQGRHGVERRFVAAQIPFWDREAEFHIPGYQDDVRRFLW